MGPSKIVASRRFSVLRKNACSIIQPAVFYGQAARRPAGAIQRVTEPFGDGGPWRAHRWAAVHIHGLELGGDEAGHCCPSGPNTLCVQHLTGQTKSENVAERNTRVANKGQQDALTRQMWLFRSLGIIEPEPENEAREIGSDAIPFFEPPTWLRPYIVPTPRENDDECPF